MIDCIGHGEYLSCLLRWPILELPFIQTWSFAYIKFDVLLNIIDLWWCIKVVLMAHIYLYCTDIQTVQTVRTDISVLYFSMQFLASWKGGHIKLNSMIHFKMYAIDCQIKFVGWQITIVITHLLYNVISCLLKGWLVAYEIRWRTLTCIAEYDCLPYYSWWVAGMTVVLIAQVYA